MPSASEQAWSAPMASAPIEATVQVPGSKSLTNRGLILAALADGNSVLRRPLASRDTELMISALRNLGASVAEDEHGSWHISPADLGGNASSRHVDCGLAGTVMRFVPPAACLAQGVVDFDGDVRARARPLATMLTALRELGADIDGDCLPFRIHGKGRLPGGTVHIDASASSQFVSGLLLSAARFEQGITVVHTAETLPSTPHVTMTVELLRQQGVQVHESRADARQVGLEQANDTHVEPLWRWQVFPGAIQPLDLDVEPDLSNATPFLAAAAVTAGQVRIPGWPSQTTQAGDAMRGILEKMGASVVLDHSGLTVAGPTELKPVDLAMHDIGELTPTVAALAALASGGASRLRGIAHLRGHESDRLAALQQELGKLGTHVEQTSDGLVIEPIERSKMTGARWHSYADHRMATAGAILGLVIPGIQVEDIATTAKTMPDFPQLWADMLGQVN